jgi:hypothetical protein
MIRKIQPLQLRDLFWDVLKPSDDFEMVSGIMPFIIKIEERPYYLYVKNISSAYFKDRPDVTRAQLPYRDDFDKVAKSGIPFIFMGYDQTNDVVVCWNPALVQDRLNAKSSVSLYSRRYYEDKVRQGEFLSFLLTNGDKVILFKRKELADFLRQIDTIFDEASKPITQTANPSDDSSSPTDRITSITDPVLIEKITPALRGNRLLEAMTICMEYYKDQYPAMKLKEWSKIVREYHKQLLSINL